MHFLSSCHRVQLYLAANTHSALFWLVNEVPSELTAAGLLPVHFQGPRMALNPPSASHPPRGP